MKTAILLALLAFPLSAHAELIELNYQGPQFGPFSAGGIFRPEDRISAWAEVDFSGAGIYFAPLWWVEASSSAGPIRMSNLTPDPVWFNNHVQLNDQKLVLNWSIGARANVFDDPITDVVSTATGSGLIGEDWAAIDTLPPFQCDVDSCALKRWAGETGIWTVQVHVQSVPEPSSLALLLVGLALAHVVKLRHS